MSTGADEIRNRIASLCAGSTFLLEQAATPFDFDRQPSNALDAVFRIEAENVGVIGGFNFSEERIDLMRIWVARRQGPDPDATYQRLQADARSLRAAIIRDGAQGGGDYGIPDAGGGEEIQHDRRTEFSVLHLTIPVSYDAAL